MGNRNVLRWDCRKSGCFNFLLRPKLEVFSEVLPDNNAFTDVDGLTMIGDKFLMIEWKRHAKDPSLTGGQGKALRALTLVAPVVVLFIAGDAETMKVESCGFFEHGRWNDFQPITLAVLREKIERWGARAAAAKSFDITSVKKPDT